MRPTVLGSIFAVGFGLLTGAVQVEAQTPISIVAGPTFANITSDEFGDTSSKTGFFAALGTSFQLNDRFSLDPYAAYVQKGAKFGDGGDEDTYSYIEIPFLLSTGFPLSETVGLGLSAGPAIAFNMDCTEKEVGEADFDCSEYTDFESTEFSFLGSVGVQFPVGTSSLGLGLGFDLGLTDVFSDVDGGYKNRVIYLFASYGMSIGGM